MGTGLQANLYATTEAHWLAYFIYFSESFYAKRNNLQINFILNFWYLHMPERTFKVSPGTDGQIWNRFTESVSTDQLTLQWKIGQ